MKGALHACASFSALCSPVTSLASFVLAVLETPSDSLPAATLPAATQQLASGALPTAGALQQPLGQQLPTVSAAASEAASGASATVAAVSVLQSQVTSAMLLLGVSALG